jgi:hypothetical protein
MKLFKKNKKKYVHPDTGDVLTASEMISWKVQDSIRNWWFVIGWTIGTAVWLKWPWMFHDDKSYTKWLIFASWLAVTVELIVAIALVGQTKRDAQIIRHILKLEKQELEHIEDILEDMGDDNDQSKPKEPGK